METALTLVRFYDEYFQRLFLDDARPRTFEAYASTLKHWRAITEDPPFPIEPATLAEFKVRLHSVLSPATVNKHLRQLNAILAKAGQPGPGNRDALGVVMATPWTRPLREERPQPRAIADALIASIYSACKFANHPRLTWCAAQVWWQALLCLAITTGFRRGALFALKWCDIRVPERLIHVRATIDKCHVDREKPLHATAIKHLLQIKGPDDLVFPFEAGRTEWYREWHRIQDLADVDTAAHIKLHDLKRFAGTRYAATASPWVVQHMLDHSSLETSRHYVNAAEACCSAVDTFPLPGCFTKG